MVVMAEVEAKMVRCEVTMVRGEDDSVQPEVCAMAKEVEASLGLGGCLARVGSSSKNNCWRGIDPKVKVIRYRLGCRGIGFLWLGDPGIGVVT
jgi:hypothetical protein